MAASSPLPALLHSTPGQVRELMEGREGTERSSSAPWQLSSAWAGSCSASCVCSPLAGLAVYCDEQSGGSCFSEGGKNAVVFVWLRSRGSGKGSGVTRNGCLGPAKSSMCIGMSWNKVGWFPSLPSSLPLTLFSSHPPCLIQPSGTMAGIRGVFFYDCATISTKLLTQGSDVQGEPHHASPCPCAAHSTPGVSGPPLAFWLAEALQLGRARCSHKAVGPSRTLEQEVTVSVSLVSLSNWAPGRGDCSLCPGPLRL